MRGLGAFLLSFGAGFQLCVENFHFALLGFTVSELGPE